MRLDPEHDLPWDIQDLFQTPEVYPAYGFEESGGIRPVLFDGPRLRGKPTRVFAWIGVPEGSRLPAMVLVHGGGGTAFRDWVELWNRRGYAAIAMDTCGTLPRGKYGNWERSECGGPPGWGGFKQIDNPVEDQWTYHAVADVVLAHSLLASQPGVDAGGIGLTGVSWGGYLSCIAASIDRRFRFCAPVYGCGRYDLCPVWDETFASLGPDRAGRWLKLWDPSTYLSMPDLPFLWVSGTNDPVYPLNAVQESYRLVRGPLHLSIRLRMPHGHGGPGEKPGEINALANHLLRGGPPLPTISSQNIDDRTIEFGCSRDSGVLSAELLYTKDAGIWEKREWLSRPAEFSSPICRAAIPRGTTVCFVNLKTSGGLTISSEHVETWR